MWMSGLGNVDVKYQESEVERMQKSKKEQHRTSAEPFTDSRERRRRRRKKAELFARLIVLSFIILISTGAALTWYFVGYAKADDEYSQLNAQFVSMPEKTIPLQTQDSAETPEETAEQAPAPEQETAAFPLLEIDFASLSSINDDFAGWIYVPGADISYPIVQGGDNDYYLRHTFEHNTSNSGAIFMDYRDGGDFSGFNTFLYGHNMKNGSMFSQLHNYRADETLIDSFPYMYIYLPGGTVRKYQICSYYLDMQDSDTYLRPDTAAAQAEYEEMILKKSLIPDKLAAVELTETLPEEEFLTLSTCHGTSGSGQRFLLHGVCVETFDTETMTASAN